MASTPPDPAADESDPPGPGPGAPPQDPTAPYGTPPPPHTGPAPPSPGPAPPPPGPPPAAPSTGAGVPTDPAQARNTAMLAHLSALVGLLGLPSLVGPLIVWLTQRDGDPYVAEQAKEALNFNLSFLIYAVAGVAVAIVLTLVTFGLAMFLLIPVFLAFGAGWLVLVIVAAMKASRGEPYRYPLTIRLVA